MRRQAMGAAPAVFASQQVNRWRLAAVMSARLLQGSAKDRVTACGHMSTTAKSAGRGLATNWDLALTSSALLVIVGGIAAPHIKRLFAGDDRETPERTG